jgi:hypothetical protein
MASSNWGRQARTTPNPNYKAGAAACKGRCKQVSVVSFQILTDGSHSWTELVEVSGQRATMLLFKKKFLPAIRSGEKTQTIRLWKFRHMRSGQRSYVPGIGRINILTVEPVDIDALTDADAIPDGFPTAAALQTELRTIYGEKLAEGYKAFRITFECDESQESRVKRQEPEGKR